jgi:hypothetical protein
MHLVLYASCCFSLTAFNSFSLFSSFDILIMILCGGFSFWGLAFLQLKMCPEHGCLYNYINMGNFLLCFYQIDSCAFSLYFSSFFHPANSQFLSFYCSSFVL